MPPRKRRKRGPFSDSSSGDDDEWEQIPDIDAAVDLRSPSAPRAMPPRSAPATVIDLAASDSDVEILSPPPHRVPPPPPRPKQPKPPPPPASARKRRRGGGETQPAMRRGARSATCLNDVDQSFEMSAAARTAALCAVYDVGGAAGNRWRVAREKAKAASDATLWGLFVAAGARGGLGAKLRGAVDAAAASEVPDELEARSGERVLGASALAYSLRRLEAAAGKAAFDARVDGSVEPAPEGDEDALTCNLCFDRFALRDAVCCSSGEALHPLCRPCFRAFCVSFATDKGVGPSAVGCPMPKCGAIFAVADVRDNVSPLDVMIMDEREADRSLRLALGGAAAVLRCPCGAVGAVSEQDAGDGQVACPNCAVVYCVRCGNAAHPRAACPPPSDMIKWLARKTKKCPKCAEPIEKDSGCNHMTCRCGHGFCWLCLGPFPNCNCGHFEAESRRVAQQVQRQQGGGGDPWGDFGGGDPFGGGGGGGGFLDFAEAMLGRRGRGRGRGRRRGRHDNSGGFPDYDPRDFDGSRRGGGRGHNWGGGGSALGNGRRG